MEVTLIANISSNGKVLLSENPKHPASPEGLGFILQKAVEAGNIVMGRKTFSVMQQFPGGIKGLLPGVEVVVLSATDAPDKDFRFISNAEKTIQYLNEKGYKEVIIGGGAQTYNAFLEKDLVTNIYFNYLPVILGDGGIIGVNGTLITQFKIADTKLLTDNISQVHFVKA